MPSATKYRPLQSVDAENVHDLECLIYPNPWALKSFIFEAEINPSSDSWIAYETDADVEPLVGYLIAWHLVDELHIANIAVHPAYRRRGIAKTLLSGALERAGHAGLQRATLEVRSGNASAQALYLAFGFAPSGLRKRYYQDNHEDAIIMSLEQFPETSALTLEGR